VVKEDDDLIAATRYTCMSLRHARTETQWDNFHRKFDRKELSQMTIILNGTPKIRNVVYAGNALRHRLLGHD
jgi:hypothetical protein